VIFFLHIWRHFKDVFAYPSMLLVKFVSSRFIYPWFSSIPAMEYWAGEVLFFKCFIIKVIFPFSSFEAAAASIFFFCLSFCSFAKICYFWASAFSFFFLSFSSFSLLFFNSASRSRYFCSSSSRFHLISQVLSLSGRISQTFTSYVSGSSGSPDI